MSWRQTKTFPLVVAVRPGAGDEAQPGGVDLMAHWQEVTEPQAKTPFRQCWEAFLHHVGEDGPYLPTLVEGAKAVQLADLA